MNISEKIHQNLEGMTRSERAVASFFLGHRGDFAFYTLENLAGEAGVSTATVIRFCRRVGFSGFKAFQEAVRRDARYRPDLPDKYRRARPLCADDALLTETLRRDAECVEQSFASLKKEELDTCVHALSGAKRVFTFGLKESFALAHYAWTRFLSVRSEVSLLSGPGEGEVETVLNLREGDVCVVFLFHRYTRLTRELLPAMRSRGARILLVTDPPVEDLLGEADMVLPCRVDAGGIKNSFSAPVVLTDYLCSALAFARGEDALAHMREAESLFRNCGIVEE